MVGSAFRVGRSFLHSWIVMNVLLVAVIYVAALSLCYDAKLFLTRSRPVCGIC